MFNRKLHKELSDLREAYTQLRQVSNSIYSEMLVLELDPQGRIQMVNENFLIELGYREADLLHKDIEQIFAPSFHNEPNYQKFRRALQCAEHLCGAFRLLDAKGHEAWLRCIWQPVQNSQGQLLRMTMCAVNLTRTIETSQEHESIIQALLRSTAVIEFDLCGHVLTANERFLNGMGYRLEQIQGKHHRMFCSAEEYNSPNYESFWNQLRRGEFVSDRFKRLDSLGRIVWLEASYNPIYDAHGELYKVVKFATVITDQINQELAVAEAATVAYGISQQTDTTAQQGAQIGRAHV